MRIEANDREGLERLLRYCARPALAAGHLECVDERHERLLYRFPKPRADGTTELVPTSLEHPTPQLTNKSETVRVS